MEGMGHLNIEGNPATTKIRTYLRSLETGQLTPQIIVFSLQKIVRELPKEKFVIHTQLFLYINNDEIRSIHNNPEVSHLTARTTTNGYPPEFYIDLVFELDLHSEFIQMVAATKGKQFSQNLITIAVSRAGIDFQNGSLSSEIVEKYLIVLGNLTRSNIKEEVDAYTLLFHKLIYEFLKENRPENNTENQSKLSTIIKLIGTVCILEVDYTDDTEIAELNREWDFDTTGLSSRRSIQVYQSLFKKPEESDPLPVGVSVLEILQGIFRNHDDLITAYDSQPDKMEYVGSCAYLARLLLKKYGKQIKNSCRKDLLNVTTRFSKFKPKQTFDDWKIHITTFKEFCERLEMFGSVKRYQSEWFQAFFQYPEIFDTECGLKVIENLVAPSADIKVATMLVDRALTLNDELKLQLGSTEDKLSYRVKKIILSLLKNDHMKEHKDEWIKTVFKKGVHSVFAKDEFKNDLNLISTKIGAIELETDAEGVAYYNEVLYSLCFQNCMEAIKTILTTSIRSQYFQALHVIDVFLTLPYVSDDKAEDITGTVTVIEENLFRNLNSIHENDPMCDYIAKGLPLLILEGLVPFETVRKLIEASVDQTIQLENFEKLVKLILFYQQLLVFALTRNEHYDFTSFTKFLDSMMLFTYIRIPFNNVCPFMLTREMCIKMKTMISEKYSPQTNNLQLPVSKTEFGGFTLIQLGLIYIRSSEDIRKQIKHFLVIVTCSWKDVMPKLDTYGKLVQSLLNWVSNTCVSEWNTLLLLLMEVVLKRPEYQNVSIYSLVNDTILGAKKEWECRTTYYLKFYAYVLSFVQNSSTENFKTNIIEQKFVFQTLVTLMLSYHETRPPKSTPAQSQNITQIFQQALLVLLDFTEWIVLNCNQYETTIRGDALNILGLLEGKLRGRSSYVLPIYQSIITRFMKGKQSIAQAALDKSPKTKFVAGVEFQAPVVMSEKIFNEYIKLSIAEETMTNGDGKDTYEKEGRDKYTFKGGRKSGKKAAFKFY